MGWFDGKVVCRSCAQEFKKKEMKLSPRERGFGVCSGCFDEWVRKGAQCVVCRTKVAGIQSVAFHADKPGLGHFDCGGVLLDR